MRRLLHTVFSNILHSPDAWAKAHRPASTWAWPAVRWLKQLHCCSVVTFDQCIFQCEGKKPTTFLLLRISHLLRAILQMGWGGSCPHSPHAHPAFQGRNVDGSFRTSIAKVNPVALNAALANAIICFLHTRLLNLDSIRRLSPGMSPCCRAAWILCLCLLYSQTFIVVCRVALNLHAPSKIDLQQIVRKKQK